VPPSWCLGGGGASPTPRAWQKSCTVALEAGWKHEHWFYLFFFFSCFVLLWKKPPLGGQQLLGSQNELMQGDHVERSLSRHWGGAHAVYLCLGWIPACVHARPQHTG
jgi:hypothetical protein